MGSFLILGNLEWRRYTGCLLPSNHTHSSRKYPPVFLVGFSFSSHKNLLRQITQYSALLSISQLSFPYLCYLLVLQFVYVVQDWIFFIRVSISLRFWALFGKTDLLNLKMKRPSVGFDQSLAADVEAKEKLKYQTLLKEYLELQKEFVSRKRKLQAAKQKRNLSLAEVRFLKQKHKHLTKSQAPNNDEDLLHLPKVGSQTDQLLLSNSLPKDEVGEGGDHVYEEDVKIKNDVSKVERKGKICWPDQVTLNV